MAAKKTKAKKSPLKGRKLSTAHKEAISKGLLAFHAGKSKPKKSPKKRSTAGIDKKADREWEAYKKANPNWKNDPSILGDPEDY